MSQTNFSKKTSQYDSNKDITKKEDPLEKCIGQFGIWQLRICLLMSLLKLPIAWFTLSIIFLAPPTQFWCKPPPNVNLSDEQWFRISIPKDNFPRKQEGLNSGYCIMVDTENDPNSTIPCIYGYSYNRSVFHSSIITEWDLVCGHQRLIDLSQITLMFGILIGNIAFGIYADRKGRKSVIVFCIIMQAVFSIVASVVPWFPAFLLARFFLAISNGGIMVASFVMCMEIVSGKWRTVVSILYQIPFGLGNSIMAGFAYLLRDWRLFHLALSIVASTFIFYICFCMLFLHLLWKVVKQLGAITEIFKYSLALYPQLALESAHNISISKCFRCIPESPRWLIAVKKNEEALVILRKAAHVNKKPLEKVGEIIDNESIGSKEKHQKSSFAILFSTAEFRKRSILLMMNWFICGITFFAFSQYLGNIGSDIFFTVATSGLIVLPGTFLCIYMVGKLGRPGTIAVSYGIMGCCFLAILLIPKGSFPHDWPRVALSSVGLTGMMVSLPALYLFTGELYPTILRNAGVGASIMFSRIGSMLSPLIISLEEVNTALPLLILASLAFIETILILPLPETKGTVLPEGIEDLGEM